MQRPSGSISPSIAVAIEHVNFPQDGVVSLVVLTEEEVEAARDRHEKAQATTSPSSSEC